jgi:DNA repair protein RadC
MDENLIILSIILFLFLIFFFSHLRPLTYVEIDNLARKRRLVKIKKYFAFHHSGCSVDKNFKSNMNRMGKFYNVSENLYSFPSIAAALLKYKKHEWIIVAFEKNQIVELLWLNKGNDNSSVNLKLHLNKMVSIMIDGNYNSAIIFHNHPNSNPKLYSMRNPSEQDIRSAKYYADELNKCNKNLIEFICERGYHFEYYRAISDNFFSVINFIEIINKENGVSKFKNFKLHIERIF